MIFILILTFFAGQSLARNIAESHPEHEEKILRPLLYRSKVLQSPLYRFKVLEDSRHHGQLAQSREVQDFQALRDKCLEDDSGLFEDPEFEAIESSLFYNKSNADNYNGIEWLRPREIDNTITPKFLVNGSSRFDIMQGRGEDCWFLAVLANIASDTTIMAQVVPANQSFEDKYCGIFHFRFWQMGRWVDVVIDDRLPTYNNLLNFTSSSREGEFWSALLEKAYAKLYGSYEALNGGFQYEAMGDLTGGIVISFDLKQLLPIPNLFEIMRLTLRRQSIITAAMLKEDSTEEKNLEKKGLPNNHAYSITNVKTVFVTKRNKNESVSLVRVRNPWGYSEWTGPWSDNSDEWNYVSEADKEALGLKDADDGEYWMSYEDFLKYFDDVEICLFDPLSFPEPSQSSGRPWNVSVQKGKWVRKSSAGGCSVASLHQNPQYQLTVENSNNDRTYLFIALMQESQRALRNFVKQEEKYLPVGFVIYKLENSSLSNQRLSAEYINRHHWSETSPSYAKWRDVTQLFSVPSGVYVIIPCTHRQDTEGEFILRVVTEDTHNLKIL